MARHYTTKDFFRHMPNSLLARYFHARGMLADFDFAGMKEAQIEPLFNAWLELPDPSRNKTDADFRAIFELGCKKGFKAIIDEAEWQFKTSANDPESFDSFVSRLSALSSHEERAMVTFLDHHELWNGASRFFHADSLTYWRKRTHLGNKSAAVDAASLQALESAISNYFHRSEGRGKNCKVEPFRRGARDYFFAYPEDYSQESIEWVRGSLEPRPHNPAFEVVFVYSQKEGSLDLNFRGSYKAIEPLQAMFAEHILKLPELPPDPKDKRVYDLGPLRQKSFAFTYEAGSGIEKVVVKKMRLSSKVKKGDRITVEADSTEKPDAVYDLLEKIGKSVPLHGYHVTQVELTASVTVDANSPPKAVNIRITHPNSCNLKYDDLDLRLRDMLHASGIEPKESEAVPDAVEIEDTVAT